MHRMTNEIARTMQVSRVRNLYASGEAKTLREAAALSLEDVALATGVDRSTVHRWENGRHRPSRSEALRVGVLLNALEQVGAR